MKFQHSAETNLRFLILERNPVAFRKLKQNLEQEFGQGLELVRFENIKDSICALRKSQFDVVLVDISAECSETTFEDNIAKICRRAQGALVIAMSEGGSVSNAVEAMRAGAHDYMGKPINVRAFSGHISELGRRHGNVKALNAIHHAPENQQFEGFVGASAQMKAVYEQISRISHSAAPVFITGESGTGKEVCAEALHKRSARSTKPFVPINCASIPHELMEGEIFGVAKGAYTGADQNRVGAAELADGGVLFLDEIGELDLKLQAKLLRFLQTGRISRVGEADSRSVDVRIICATNRDPLQLIHEKKFREDLFYRLHVLPIHLPPLRQRPADILPLAQLFLKQFSAEENKDFSRFAPETINLIAAKDWPGNVRQLQNMIRRAVVMFDGPEFNSQMLGAADNQIHPLASVHFPAEPRSDLRNGIEPMWRQEQKIIETALAYYKGNISLAAAALEISPSTIYRKKQAWEVAQNKQVFANAIVA